ncbi:hypothetical protein [Streptomyces sp. Amel2xC10]|uniref:hypothetical protein n=1 Tax=Streptomyces sp. Amel2xC10 TaxID=1305826 RepID=UPI002119D802|nr:hypothetical protein [Streptomyces sp. Amel2xC10]
MVAAVTAVVTTLAVGLFVAPRMEARKKRFGEVHTARDTFGANMMRIISVCSLLQRIELPPADDPDCTPIVRERIAGERARWLQQLDDATLWLIDNVTTYAGSWPMRHLIRLAVDYAGHARAVMLSEREEDTKVELLLALTVPVQRQFFGGPWSRARHLFADHRAFAETLTRISGEPTASLV